MTDVACQTIESKLLPSVDCGTQHDVNEVEQQVPSTTVSIMPKGKAKHRGGFIAQLRRQKATLQALLNAEPPPNDVEANEIRTKLDALKKQEKQRRIAMKAATAAATAANAAATAAATAAAKATTKEAATTTETNNN